MTSNNSTYMIYRDGTVVIACLTLQLNKRIIGADLKTPLTVFLHWLSYLHNLQTALPVFPRYSVKGYLSV